MGRSTLYICFSLCMAAPGKGRLLLLTLKYSLLFHSKPTNAYEKENTAAPFIAPQKAGTVPRNPQYATHTRRCGHQSQLSALCGLHYVAGLHYLQLSRLVVSNCPFCITPKLIFMKKKIMSRKLSLAKKTIHPLTGLKIDQVRGGGSSEVDPFTCLSQVMCSDSKNMFSCKC